MTPSAPLLQSSEAARRLGVSVKALRVYELRGLVRPTRTAAGWRVYGPGEMAQLADIVALRELGLSLGQLARVLRGEAKDLLPALAAHQGVLEARIHELAATVERVRCLRTDLTQGHQPVAADLTALLKPTSAVHVAFDLPWPWGGEPFELRDVRALTYIVGPLGSGKTRLAQRLAESLPDGAFLGLQRLDDDGADARQYLDEDPALRASVDRTLSWLMDEGATVSTALITLLVALEASASTILIIDMLEQGLEQATQEALIAWLRRRPPGGTPLFFTTRSSSILDPDDVGSSEAIIFCPANHSVPILVAPHPGAPGYEAVASCLASPEVRARTAGVIAWRPEVA